MKEYGLIYEAHCIINNKKYFGLTTKTLHKRKYLHEWAAAHNAKTIFHKALVSLGFNNFKWTVIGTLNSKEELVFAEQSIIELYQSNNIIYGYNGTRGGEGTFGMTPWNKGKVWSQEVRSKISVANSGKNKDEHPRWKNFDISLMIQKKQEGLSYREIGNIFGVDKQIIYKRFYNLKREGIIC